MSRKRRSQISHDWEGGFFESGTKIKNPTYHDETNPRLAGKPLVECLWELPEDDAEIDRMLSIPPQFPKDASELSSRKRRDLLGNLAGAFIPGMDHYDLTWKLQQSLRHGLAGRNRLRPADLYAASRQAKSVAPVFLGEVERPEYDAKGFLIYGWSGTGKTTSILHILQSTIPQVIEHTSYRGKPFRFHQLGWLFVKAPHNGSILQFGDQILRSIDGLLGTDYRREYIGAKHVMPQHTTTMITSISHVANLHALGLLVIDDIQYLVNARGRNQEDFTNFTETLVDLLGLPVITLGTYRALELFNNSLRTARRGAGQGDVEWPRLSRDDEFPDFVEALWPYLLLRDGPSAPTKELLDAFYWYSQGITDYVMKLFRYSQDWALREGEERLTPELVKAAFHKYLRGSHKVIAALQRKDIDALKELEDGMPPIFLVTDVPVPPKPKTPEAPSSKATDNDQTPKEQEPAGRGKKTSTKKKPRQPKPKYEQQASSDPEGHEKMAADGKVASSDEVGALLDHEGHSEVGG